MNDDLSLTDEEAVVPRRQTAELVALVCGGILSVVTITLPVLGASYALHTRVTHVAILLLCIGCWLGLKYRKLDPNAVLYLIGISLALSNVALLQLVGGVENTIPSVLLLLCALIIPVPTGLVIWIASISLINLVVAELRFDFQVSRQTLLLLTVVSGAIVLLTQMVRRQREHFYLRLRSEALDWANRVAESANAARLLQEQVAHDEKLRSLGSLAGGVVHDVNNLLVPIVGNADLLLAESDDEGKRRQLRDILRAAEKASQLTAQLNAFAGGTVIISQTVDLRREIAEIRDLLWRGLDGDVEINLEQDDTPIFVSADRAHLHQIFANLLTNALEAAAGAEDRPGIVNVRAQVRDGAAHVEVSDNGPGIPAAIRQRLFEPFQTTKGKGRGMGLAAVHGAVRRSGGSVEARSGESGTTMVVRLPLAEEGPTEAPHQSACADLAGVSAMVVDDEEHVRETIVAMLSTLVAHVCAADSGEVALDMLADGHRPDVIVLDMRMPGMGGPRTLSEIRHRHRTQPVVICTGYALGADAGASNEAYTTVLRKPFNRALLSDALGRVLQR